MIVLLAALAKSSPDTPVSFLEDQLAAKETKLTAIKAKIAKAEASCLTD